MAGKPDPRPPRRVKASQAEWEAIKSRYGHVRCVVCGRPGQSLHHLVPKSQGGDDLPINLVPLCGSGTTGCHGIFETHSKGYSEVAGDLRDFICRDPERWAYVHGKLGDRGFDRRYPHPRIFVPCPHFDCTLAAHHSGNHINMDGNHF